MIDVWDVTYSPPMVTYFCPDCEERFGVEVRVSVPLMDGEKKRKWTRVDRFFEHHEQCGSLEEQEGERS